MENNTLVDGQPILIKENVYHTNDKGVHFHEIWIAAKVSEGNADMGETDMVWTDHISPQTGQLLTMVPVKMADIKPFPTKKSN